MRLIDADWLTELYDGLDEYEIKVAVVKANIDDAPTIDAVEVVRCRECKYYETLGYRQGCGFCLYFGGVVKDDDYCSYGEGITE